MHRRCCPWVPCAGALVGLLLLAIFSACDHRESHAVQRKRGRSDLNGDGVVDLLDLQLYAHARGLDWEAVDWCRYVLDNESEEEYYAGLFDFIREHYECGVTEPPLPPEDPLKVKHANRYPVRLAWGPSGSLYVTDSKVGSVFIYDSTLKVTGELKGLDRPLGVVVDDFGNIYVGNDGRDNVEVHDAAGTRIASVGQSTILMPNDLELDADGNLYVVDSKSNLVRVYDPDGRAVRTITDGDLRFPSSLAITYSDDGTGQTVGELYVGDQGHHKVKVFDLQGGFLRSFGRQVPPWGTFWQGRFNCLQSLAVDATGGVHAVDTYLKRVQILRWDTGAFLDSYGEAGSAPGQLALPMDIAIHADGRVAISDFRNHRVEIIHTVP